MSIIKSNYGNVKNVTVVEFGKGTICITNGRNETYKSLLIKEKEYNPVGTKGDFIENSDVFQPKIAIVFHNRESFNVFKEFVNNIDIEFSSENDS